MMTDIVNADLEKVRQMLKDEAADLCKSAEDTPLPPLHSIQMSPSISRPMGSETRCVLEGWTLEICDGAKCSTNAVHSEETGSKW